MLNQHGPQPTWLGSWKQLMTGMTHLRLHPIVGESLAEMHPPFPCAWLRHHQLPAMLRLPIVVPHSSQEAWQSEFWAPQASEGALQLVAQLAAKCAWLPDDAVQDFAGSVPQVSNCVSLPPHAITVIPVPFLSCRSCVDTPEACFM